MRQQIELRLTVISLVCLATSQSAQAAGLVSVGTSQTASSAAQNMNITNIPDPDRVWNENLHVAGHGKCLGYIDDAQQRSNKNLGMVSQAMSPQFASYDTCFFFPVIYAEPGKPTQQDIGRAIFAQYDDDYVADDDLQTFRQQVLPRGMQH